MSHFCLLRDPENYVAHDWDMVEDADAREYWLDLFAMHFEDTAGHASHRYGRTAGRQIKAAREEFASTVASLRDDPTALPGGTLDILQLCRLRERVLRDHDIGAPFKHIKDRENTSAIALYAEIVHELHALPFDQRWLALIEGVFAGNIFDLGSPATMHTAHESPDFLDTLDNIRPRPWACDDFDRLAQDLPMAPPPKWTRAVVFIDNAGSDFILGVMPFVRELALEGVQIVLAANELPSLNDLTADETATIVEKLSTIDRDLAALIDGQMFEVVSTGCDTPLIDLSEVTDELNEAAADADLVIIEGMGRAIESNFNTAFTVDCLQLALLKDPRVAAHFVGAELYDCVCKYTPVDPPEDAQDAPDDEAPQNTLLA